MSRSHHAARRGPPTTTATIIHFDLEDFATGSAFVWFKVAFAASPCQDAVTRMRKGPSIRLGMRPLPRPCHAHRFERSG